MDKNEDLFLQKLRGVQGYVKGLKEREPGYTYDNENEFTDLVKIMKDNNYTNEEMLSILSFLSKDIEEIKKRKACPIRTQNEENFYRKICGINSYITGVKTNEKFYIFDNVRETEDLLKELENLNTKDPDILAIMHIITKDIKIVLKNNGEDINKFQEQLDKLEIKPTEKPEIKEQKK